MCVLSSLLFVGLYIAEDDSFLGLYFYYWPLPVSIMANIANGSVFDIVLERTKTITESTENRKCSKGTDQTGYSKCIRDWIRRNADKANCSRGKYSGKAYL